MTNSREYWRRRFEFLEDTQNKKAVDYYQDLEKAYIQTFKENEKDIATWYQRFADNNEISLVEAKRLLQTDELLEFKWTVEEYIKYGEENALNHAWMKQLENASARVHISRLESLQLQLRHHIEILYADQIDSFERVMKEIYQNQYYQTAFEIQKAFEVGFTMQAFDKKVLNKVISKPWTADKMTFSARIWRDRNLLIDTLHTELTQAFVRGEGPQRVINVMQKKMRTSRENVARLVQTEQAFFSASAQKEAFKELDVEKYEIVATLDSKTSDICQSLDGKVFKMNDYEPGVTANPFHPRCRTTTAPYFEDDNYGQRIARDVDGETFYVPSNMTYREWYSKQVEAHGKDKIALENKKQKNFNRDQEQYREFKKKIGQIVPNSFEDFQELKYNNEKDWNLFNGYKRALEKEDIHTFVNFETYKEIANNIQSKLVGKTTSDGIFINGYKTHFIDRVIGQVESGTSNKNKRSGVRIEDALDAIENPSQIRKKANSRQYINEKCIVTINHATGNLIQTTPKTKG